MLTGGCAPLLQPLLAALAPLHLPWLVLEGVLVLALEARLAARGHVDMHEEAR
jgi:hypothetical protein